VRARCLGSTGFAALLILLALALVPVNLAAEVASSVTITGYNTLYYSGDPEDPVAVAAVLKSSLNVDSVGNKNVKAYLQLESWITDTVNFDVPRAYIKVRFPWFRLTLGKTRVSWGDGFVFNAGDVVFASMGTISDDLFAETLRDETAWLVALNLPVGPFSFFEAVFLPYDPLGLGDSSHPVSGGVRGAFKLDRLKTTVEAGYLVSRPYWEHRPYISLHGHLLVDWNLSASMAIPIDNPQWRQWDEWIGISAGMFHLVNLGLNRTLSFRLEAAIRPGAEWEEASAGTDYGLFLFPEIAFSPTDTLSLQLRSFVSPVDQSALFMVGGNWNVYQGLDVFSYLTFMAGEWKKDFFSLDQEGSVSWTAGLEFVY
jgi:hypothetical protein